MRSTTHLYSNLPRFAGGNTVVETEGNNVGECLKQLVQQYPDLQPIIFEKNGQLSRYIYVSINLESPTSEPLEKPLKANDHLYLIMIVAGG
jgi:molybdopterin converting factor small subunit